MASAGLSVGAFCILPRVTFIIAKPRTIPYPMFVSFVQGQHIGYFRVECLNDWIYAYYDMRASDG